jgi:peptidoglycan hydrolase-like protein with peptidoglycan-binding domain
MRQFQRAAGINADGLYGGSTRGALIYFGVRNPPAAYVRSTSRGRETVAYQPPSPAAAA